MTDHNPNESAPYADQAEARAMFGQDVGTPPADFTVKDEGDFVFVTAQSDRARALCPYMLEHGYFQQAEIKLWDGGENIARDNVYVSAPAIADDLVRNGYTVEEW